MNCKPAIVACLLASQLVAACAGLNSSTESADEARHNAEEMLPDAYANAGEGENSAEMDWQQFFDDPHLLRLIETALANNQELNILLQEVEIARNRVGAATGEYLPFVDLRAGAGTAKSGEFTPRGSVEENLPLRDGEAFPEPVPEYLVSLNMSWEVDIWNRLRNEKKAAVLKFLATREGQNFMVTHLVAEIAESYYELLALDSNRAILERMLELQTQALDMVRLQKAAARATELAVRRFEAEVAKNRSELNLMQQRIVEVENRLNFLAGRLPQRIERSSDTLENLMLGPVQVGTPEQLLVYRPDIRRAELALAAAELDVRAARARFYPSLDVTAAIGYESSEGDVLFSSPESVLYNIAGDLVVPVLNRRAIQAAYDNASVEQLKALYEYQQTVLNAYIEVQNQAARLRNLADSYANKKRQTDALAESVEIANSLYRSARADYTEVLLTQRDALESRMELVELRQQQLAARVRMYQALGGGYERKADDAS